MSSSDYVSVKSSHLTEIMAAKKKLSEKMAERLNRRQDDDDDDFSELERESVGLIIILENSG